MQSGLRKNGSDIAVSAKDGCERGSIELAVMHVRLDDHLRPKVPETRPGCLEASEFGSLDIHLDDIDV